jgi:phosphoribosylformylglycinamidine synthase I
MKSAVVVFPGSNRENDVVDAIERSSGHKPVLAWHRDTDLPDVDLIVLPGGFSYGDYLRTGAIAARSPVMREVARRAEKGTPVIGICNGFQILCESGLLPGILLRNASLKFICRNVCLKVETNQSLFTQRYQTGDVVSVPVAHGDGNYFADTETLDRLEAEGRVAFRYCASDGKV